MPEQQQPAPPPRRRLLAACALAAVLPPPRRASAASALDAAAALGTAAALDDSAFYARWPYTQPADALPFVRAHVPPGDAAAALAALDVWSLRYPNFSCGREKAALLGAELRRALPPGSAPASYLELGSFIGYSALVASLALPPGSALVCVEASERAAGALRSLLSYADVAGAAVVVGLAAEALPAAQRALPRPRADFVFVDHAKEVYLGDVKRCEALGVVGPGTTVCADNVVYPGAPGYLEWVATGGPGGYATRLLPCRFEYDRLWEPGWPAGGRADAMAVSLKL